MNTSSCSIVIPTKDRPAGLLRAVQSALAAAPVGSEVIVVDDNSRPPAAQTLAEISTQQLRVITNPGPHGPSAARNFGANASENSILFFLDDDDVLLPDYCQRVLDRLPRLDPKIGYGFSAVFNDEGDGKKQYYKAKLPNGPVQTGAPLNDRLAGLGTGFWIRREVFFDVGALDDAIRVNEDTEFSIRLASRGIDVYYDTDPGVVITHDPARNNSDQSSITKSANAAQRAFGFEYILGKHRDFLLRHGGFRRKLLFRVMKYRSRARKTSGWFGFCRSIRPLPEALAFLTLGSVWLYLSIAIRKLSDTATLKR